MSGAAVLWVPATIAVVALSGCSSPPEALGTHTAQVTVADGQAQRYPITCSQINWQWTIETPEHEPGFTAIVNTGPEVTAGLVYLRDVDGFSGTFGDDVVGDAQASVEDGVFRISGTAFGESAEQPAQMVRRSFSIQTTC